MRFSELGEQRLYLWKMHIKSHVYWDPGKRTDFIGA